MKLEGTLAFRATHIIGASARTARMHLVAEERIKRDHKAPDTPRITSRECPITGEDQPWDRPACLQGGNRESAVVRDILRYDCTPFGPRDCEDDLVRLAAQVGALGNCDDIVAAFAERLRD